MLTAVIVVMILMTPLLAPKLFGLELIEAQAANLAASAALCVSTLVVGAATDRFGIRRVAVAILLLLIASTYGLYFGAKAMPLALLPLYSLAGLGAGAAVLAPITMIHAFPASIRFSGVSFCFNVGYAIFGGLTPLLVLWLVHLDRMGPAHYIAAVTVASLAATLMAPSYRTW